MADRTANRIRNVYSERIPILVIASPYHLKVSRLLVPRDFTLFQLLSSLKRDLGIEHGLYASFRGKIYPVTEEMSRIDSECRDNDGFLRATLFKEVVAG